MANRHQRYNDHIIYSLLPTQICIIPFILTVVFTVFSAIFLAIGWNALAGAFDILEFKHIVFQLNIAGDIGAILTALLLPIMVYLFHLPGLFFVAIVANVMIAIGLLFLKQLPIGPIKKRQAIQSQLHKQTLFIFLFLLVVIGLLIEVLGDFSFKVMLMEHYSQDGIAVFLSFYKVSLSILGLLLQLFIAQGLMTRMVCQVYCIYCP